MSPAGGVLLSGPLRPAGPTRSIYGRDGRRGDRPLFALARRRTGVSFCLVKVEEPAAGYPVRIPVAPEVARRALDFVRRFPGCFWFWKEEPPMTYKDDVEAVIRNLRDYGDKAAWEAAKELRRCL